MIDRYDYCTKFPQTAPFPGYFDNIPAIWYDFNLIMSNELNEITRTANG